MTSAVQQYASHWIALPCSPLITSEREKSQDILISCLCVQPFGAFAVALLKCTTPIANIHKNGTKGHVSGVPDGARFTPAAEEGFSLCLKVLQNW